MFLGRIYASRWRKNAQQLAKIKGPNKNLPLVANNANLKQAEKQQRTRADFSQVMSQFIIQVLYLFFVVIWIWTLCWISTFWICWIWISIWTWTEICCDLDLLDLDLLDLDQDLDLDLDLDLL